MSITTIWLTVFGFCILYLLLGYEMVNWRELK